MPDTAPATVYVPKNSAYTLRSPDLYGYTCVGNSANQGEINITEDRQEITYYYRKNSEMPEIQTVPVRVTYDGKPHTFDIKQEDGVQISYSLTENGSYTQTEMPFYTEAGQYKIYLSYPAEAVHKNQIVAWDKRIKKEFPDIYHSVTNRAVKMLRHSGYGLYRLASYLCRKAYGCD